MLVAVLVNGSSADDITTRQHVWVAVDAGNVKSQVTTTGRFGRSWVTLCAGPTGVRGGNSPNHGGKGQNVLFRDGSVKFCKSPELDGDNIYLNKFKKVATGLDVAGVPKEIVAIMQGVIVFSVVIAYELVRRYRVRSEQREVGRALGTTKIPEAAAI